MLREHRRGSLVAAALAATIAAGGGALAAAGAAPSTGTAALKQRAVAKNVIFIQGDGMGIAHRELIRLVTKGKNGKLAIDGLRYAGWTYTDSSIPRRP